MWNIGNLGHRKDRQLLTGQGLKPPLKGRIKAVESESGKPISGHEKILTRPPRYQVTSDACQIQFLGSLLNEAG